MDQRRAGLGHSFRLYFLSELQPLRRYNASPRTSMRRLHPPGYTQNGTLTKPPDDEFDNGYSETTLLVEEQSDNPSPVTQLLEKQFTRSSHAHSHIWCTEETRDWKEERIKNEFVDEQGYSHYNDDLSGEEENLYNDDFTSLVSTLLTQSTPKRKGYLNDRYQLGTDTSIKNEENSRNKESQRSIEIKVETSRQTQEPSDKRDPEAVDAVNNASSKTGPLSEPVISQESSEKLTDLPTADRSPDISMIPSGSDHINSVDCSTEFGVPKQKHVPEKSEKKAEEIKNSSEDGSISKKKTDFVTYSNEKVQAEPKQWTKENIGTEINEKTPDNHLSFKQHSGKTSVHFDTKEDTEDSHNDFDSLYTDHPLDDEAFGTVNEDNYKDTSYGKEKVPTSGQMPNTGRYSYGVNQFLNMPIFMQSIRQFATDNQFELHDVTPDGNCMFRAMEDQLNINGDLGYTPKMLRQTAVRYLRNNPCQSDGSRLEDFLSTESWEEYLTRMQQNFQWGDHMILKALADALNLTVIVVNVYEDDIRRTEIPAEGRPVTRRQKLTIFLGHIGEFHYLSLRPADWEKDWPYKSLIRRRQVNCRIEDSSKLLRWIEQNIGKDKEKSYIPDFTSDDTSSKDKQKELFVLDNSSHFVKYALQNQQLQLDDSDDSRMALIVDPLSVDTVTGLTLPHFSFILNFVLHRFDTFIGKASLKMDDIPVGSGESVFENTFYGAAVDGTNVYIRPFRQGVKMHQEIHRKTSNSPTLIASNPDIEIVFPANENHTSSVSTVYAEECDTHPGYCRLKKPDQTFEDIYLDILTGIQSEIYLKEIPISEGLKKMVKARGITKMFCGYKCLSFPPSVRKKWQSIEENMSHWPSAQVNQKVKSSGCLIVQKAHPLSRVPETEWKYVFAEGEKILIKEGLTLFQRKTFLVFKLLVEHTTRYAQRPLKNKHIKNVFFFACENIVGDVWDSNIGGCLIYLVAYLLDCLKKRSIPHYFIAKNNLLDYYSEEEVQELCIHVEALRVFPVQCLEHLLDAYGWKSILESRLTILCDCEHFARTRDINHSWLNVFIPSIIKSMQYLVQQHLFEIAYTSLKLAFEEILLAPMTSDPPSFQDLFLKTLSTIEDPVDKEDLAYFFDQEFGTDILAKTKSEAVLVRDIVGGELDERVGCLEVPKYYTHNKLDLAQLLDKKAYISHCKGENEMAKLLLLTSINCAKCLFKDHMGFEINDLGDEKLIAEIKQQKSVHSRRIVTCLMSFYQHLITVCSVLQDFLILHRELEDLTTYRATFPAIDSVIQYVKSQLDGNVVRYQFQNLSPFI